MQDKDLFQKLLGLVRPWTVSKIDLSLEQRQVHVYVVHEDIRWTCPECGQEGPTYDHGEERVWRHLDTMQYTTLLHAAPPRIKCSEHGVRSVRLPWGERNSRFTLLFERLAIEVLLLTSVSAGARLLGVSWDEAWGIQKRAVERGQKRKEHRPPAWIGVDEKSIGRGQDAYMTLVCDAKEGHVEWIAEGRKAESLGKYFEQFTQQQLLGIEAVAMDVWRGFTKAVQQYVPNAEDKMIYDRFHVMQEVGEAVDKVRKSEHREMLIDGDKRLAGTKYLWLRSSENVPRKFRRAFAVLKAVIVKTSRAWSIKESLRELWELKTLAGAERFFKRWYFWATHSRLPAVIAAAKKLYRHRAKLLNYFRVRLTNAMSESINGRIEKLNRIAHGYRNTANFKVAVLFRFGGLDLFPAIH